jgi:hypothetical protein
MCATLSYFVAVTGAGLLALQRQDVQLPQNYLTSLPSVVGRLEVALAALAKDSAAYNAQAGTALFHCIFVDFCPVKLLGAFLPTVNMHMTMLVSASCA